MNRLVQWFFRPVDNTPLILFRVLFGIILALEGFGSILTGWVKETFIDPEVHFPFIGFEWLQPLPGCGMYIYYVILG
ncbi:MAG TPA: HTTM domain-containing protein, partial [Cytophagaceae bacterium]